MPFWSHVGVYSCSDRRSGSPVLRSTSPAKKSSSRPAPKLASFIAPAPLSTTGVFAAVFGVVADPKVLNYRLGSTTESFVIVLILFVSFSMRSSLFLSALLSFSLIKMWFSLESLRLSLSFFIVLKSLRALYSFSSSHWTECSSFLTYSC